MINQEDNRRIRIVYLVLYWTLHQYKKSSNWYIVCTCWQTLDCLEVSSSIDWWSSEREGSDFPDNDNNVMWCDENVWKNKKGQFWNTKTCYLLIWKTLKFVKNENFRKFIISTSNLRCDAFIFKNWPQNNLKFYKVSKFFQNCSK